MTPTAPPTVPRHNPWGYWNPVIAQMPQEEFFRHMFVAKNLSSTEAAAIYQYCAFTGHDGIEFVLLSRHLDRAAFRRLAGGIILVPCEETRNFPPKDRPTIPPAWFLYDGWLPIESASEDAIVRGLGIVEETMSTLAFAHGVSARWGVKYAEGAEGGVPNPTREIDDEDFEDMSKLIEAMSRLPLVVREAVTRAIHWLQHAEQSRYPTDRFLARYYAFEGLCLALWENAADLELPVTPELAQESKQQRRKRQDAEIRRIVDQLLSTNPRKAVEDAYFTVLKSIKQQTRSVLHAALGAATDESTWVLEGRESASTLRSELAHGKIAGLDVHSTPGFRDKSERLAKLTQQLIGRTLGRRWQVAPLAGRTRQYTITMSFGDSFICAPNGGAVVTGDFRITAELVAGKGLTG
jgi:hypothetical protein